MTTKGIPTADHIDIIEYPRACRDLTDKFFGDLTVLGYVGSDKQDNWWLCFCTRCLRTMRKRDSHLRSGLLKTCGKKGCKLQHGVTI